MMCEVHSQDFKLAPGPPRGCQARRHLRAALATGRLGYPKMHAAEIKLKIDGSCQPFIFGLEVEAAVEFQHHILREEHTP